MSIDVIVPALAVILTTAVAAALIVPWIGMAILQRMRRVPSPLWAALVLAPAMIAVLIGIALLAPAPFGACHCAVHAPHHPHLCMAHPELAGPLLAPALVLLVAWAIFAARGVWNVGADAFRAARWVEQRGGPGLCVDGVQVRIADCGAPLAVAAGAFTPKIIVDHELWSALSAQERRVVVQHEHAHAVRRDGLTLHVLRAAAALSLIPLPSRLIEAWRTSAELDCDRYASAAVGDPLAVASTLLSVERICANRSKAEVPHALLAARPGGALDRRVRALADLRAHQSTGLANDLLVVGSLIGGCALIVLAWPSGGVHHTLETLLGWALG